MGTSHAPPSPRRLDRLNPSINRTRPSANRKFGAERSTGFTRAVSIRGGGDLIPSVAGIDDDCCGASFPGGVSFACSGQENSDFGGTAPTFLYQHLRPSIWRHDHEPDSDFGALRHSIACADEVATQQQTSRVVTSAFMTGFNLPANLGLFAVVFRHIIEQPRRRTTLSASQRPRYHPADKQPIRIKLRHYLTMFVTPVRSALKLDAGGVDDLLPSLQLLAEEGIIFRRRLWGIMYLTYRPAIRLRVRRDRLTPRYKQAELCQE